MRTKGGFILHILVIEDNVRLNDAITEILKTQKYMVDSVYDGRDGYDYAVSGIYDCIILDVMLPQKSGFQICSELRQNKISTPILMLTAKNQISDKVTGLDLGADDYMTKPFATEELLARIRTLCRRKGEVIINELSYSDLCFNTNNLELYSKATGKSVRLSFKESEITKLLLSKPSTTISKEEIITRVWGYDAEIGDNNVETYISFLRKKFSFIGTKVQIISLKKIGYILSND